MNLSHICLLYVILINHFRSYSFVKNVPILLTQRVDSRRVKKLESKVVGISRTNDMIPETKVYNRKHHEYIANQIHIPHAKTLIDI